MEQLKGKVALITGGSSGIGLEIAKALAQEGVNIAITGRNFDKLESAITTLDQYEIDTTAIVCDNKNAEDIKSCVAHVLETFDHIDILVNNAGVMKNAPFLETSEALLDELIQTNVYGPFRFMQEVAPVMIKQGQGDIVNMSSMSAVNANANSSAYSATKFALSGMSDSFMREMRPHNIRTFLIHPSAVLTDLIGEPSLEPESMTHPEDIAEVIVSQLKLNRRTFVKQNQIWATNPVKK
ncbi:SDR family NAD(P)-dependent oxidoreductase [Macrococcoides goetzii]|uniref:Diacetyl reductase [(S)-acetoin forming] n=1 Tax=Macrococcoides goetzii TaxID=1891097 RepID=A0A395GCC8_9STAP|nr:SDR family NAD(P)-dependent oxidoreductase [Macrococcus goetzii]RAI81468.1 SDR family NAD(P)-dependent oxidoreductase [Macrococcus goetzii]